MTEDRWHQPLVHVRGRELRGDTGQTPGMTRREAISGQNAGSEKVWMGQTHVAPGTRSGDHHHGEAETAIYVLSGTPAFVFALGDGGHCRDRPGSWISELERGAVPQRPPVGAGPAWRGTEIHHPVAAQPPGYLHGQVTQQPRQPGQVIAGVEENQEVRVTVAPVPGSDDPFRDLADLRGSDLGCIVGRAEAEGI